MGYSRRGSTDDAESLIHMVKKSLWLPLGLVLLVGLMVASLFIGNYEITFHDLRDYLESKLSGGAYNTSMEAILVNIRLPRMIASVVIGAALSVAGLVYQSVFSNNMVSPDLLGVSSSAACGAAIAILLGFSKYMRFASSFALSLFAIILTMFLSKLLKRKDSLLLSGIITAGFARSALGLLKYLADAENGELESIVYWELGSLAKITWSDLLMITPIIAILLVILYLFRRRICCLSLGRTATLLGIRVSVESILAIALSSLLVSLSTALCGVISWVGLIIPIGAADMTQRGDIVHNFAVTALLGSVFLLICDNIARSATSAEIPISIMTGAAGLIIFCVSIFRTKRGQKLEYSGS